jgi:hypothetical protein
MRSLFAQGKQWNFKEESAKRLYALNLSFQVGKCYSTESKKLWWNWLSEAHSLLV